MSNNYEQSVDSLVSSLLLLNYALKDQQQIETISSLAARRQLQGHNGINRGAHTAQAEQK
jgi:hypothetical protein